MGNWLEERQRKQDEKWARVHEIAMKQGLIVTQISPRRYIVAKLSSSGGICGAPPKRLGEPQMYYTYLSSERVFGPADWTSCRQYVHAYAVEHEHLIPEELARS